MTEYFLTEEIVQRILSSLALKIKKHLLTTPVLVGIGESGQQIVSRLGKLIENDGEYVCDVIKGPKKTTITGFPYKEIKRKSVLACYANVKTGGTFNELVTCALEHGAKEVKTLSLVVSASTKLFPNFFGFMLNDHDNVYFLLNDPEPDPEIPPVHYYSTVLTELSNRNMPKKWLTTGDERVDSVPMEVYLYDREVDPNYRTYISINKDKAIALLHFVPKNDHVLLDTIGIDKNASGKGLGTTLMRFLVDYCRFHRINKIVLDSLDTSKSFYERLGFKEIKKIHLKNYILYRMEVRIR